ncbi:MAG TPA: hypothetical protein VGO52_18025 [Hyphomonadaceae bacterium]|nr:hypothetical protein [Hyphomonadaceae bacterium]
MAVGLIEKEEGFRSCAYDDLAPNKILKPGDRVKGTLTIGFGRTGAGLEIGDCVDEASERKWLASKVQALMQEVERRAARAMTPTQVVGWTSAAYNLGPRVFGYKAFKAFQMGDDLSACYFLLSANLAGGKPILAGRRKRETEQICPQR